MPELDYILSPQAPSVTQFYPKWTLANAIYLHLGEDIPYRAQASLQLRQALH